MSCVCVCVCQTLQSEGKRKIKNPNNLLSPVSIALALGLVYVSLCSSMCVSSLSKCLYFAFNTSNEAGRLSDAMLYHCSATWIYLRDLNFLCFDPNPSCCKFPREAAETLKGPKGINNGSDHKKIKQLSWYYVCVCMYACIYIFFYADSVICS